MRGLAWAMLLPIAIVAGLLCALALGAGREEDRLAELERELDIHLQAQKRFIEKCNARIRDQDIAMYKIERAMWKLRAQADAGAE